MFDDDTGRDVEGLDAFPGGIRVGDIVVGQFLALQLGVGGDAASDGIDFSVEGGALVRVLAIAQRFNTIKGELQPGREDRRCRRGFIRLGFGPVFKSCEPVGDHAVVAGSVGEGFFGEIETRLERQCATVGLHFIE